MLSPDQADKIFRRWRNTTSRIDHLFGALRTRRRTGRSRPVPADLPEEVALRRIVRAAHALAEFLARALPGPDD